MLTLCKLLKLTEPEVIVLQFVLDNRLKATLFCCSLNIFGAADPDFLQENQSVLSARADAKSIEWINIKVKCEYNTC